MVDWPPVPLKQKHEAFSTLTILCFDVGKRRAGREKRRR